MDALTIPFTLNPSQLYDLYIYYFNERRDTRVDDWFLMSSYKPTIILTLIYLFIVCFGSKLMENKKAFSLNWSIFFYNVFLVLLNLHICTEILFCSTKMGYSYICQPCISSDDQCELRIAKAIWWYYFSKLIEFMDTIFFILRKKKSQITFLHVYHHATMFPIWYISARWIPCGDAFFGAMLNSFVHVLMYTYYAIAALGEKYQKYLWWKKYMTKVQLIQFWIGISHSAISIIAACNFPMWTHWALIFYGFSLMALFINFYNKAYTPKKNGKLKEENGDITKKVN